MFFKNGEYFLQESWTSFKRGGLMTILAIATIAVSIFIMGLFLIIFIDLSHIMKTLNTKLDVVAYVKQNVNDQHLETINKKLSGIKGVKKLSFVAKEISWMRFKESFSNVDLESFVDENPLPDAFKLEVIDLSYIDSVAKSVRNIEEIDDVRYGGDIVEKIEVFIKVVNSAGFFLVLLLSFATFVIVVNTIRMTVLARSNEIKIMSLVGATKSFIRYPFIMEGILIGLIGAVLSSMILKVGYNVAVINIEKAMPFIPINLNSMEINFVFIAMCFMGIFLGHLGGYVSVNRTFKEIKEN